MHDSLAQIESAPTNTQGSMLIDTLTSTAFKTVESSTSSAEPLFSIQPGVTAHVALTQMSELLRCAELNTDEVCLRLEGFERDLLMGMIHSVALSRTVVEALLEQASQAA